MKAHSSKVCMPKMLGHEPKLFLGRLLSLLLIKVACILCFSSAMTEEKMVSFSIVLIFPIFLSVTHARLLVLNPFDELGYPRMS